jgi:CDP-2,3-bis-(O-geranylgeranyl)-sn-glycerol synthase
MSEADLWKYTSALLLLGIANGAPVIGKKLLGRRFAFPLDGGLEFPDGRPLFGPSKTVRGIALAIAATTLAAPVFGLSWQTGVLFGTSAMLGDLLSSFAKRRLDRPPSSQALGLDQIPESLLPLVVCRASLGLDGVEIAALVAAFVVLELLLSRLLYRLRVRDRPY